MNITIIGCGIYSLAIANLLAKNDNEIKIWTHLEQHVVEFKNTGSVISLSTEALSNKISITDDLESAIKNSDLIYIVTSSSFFKDTVIRMREYYNGAPICIATKGLDEVSLSFLTNVISDCLNTEIIGVLSGPTFAIDLINDHPGALTLSSKYIDATTIIKKSIESSSLKLDYNSDIIGTQICGFYKNIIAIAAGIINGMGYSTTTSTLLIKDAIDTLGEIIEIFGGEASTVNSYAGIGDMILTCTSTKSRNYSFGKLVGSTNDYQEVIKYINENTVEGYGSVKNMKHLLYEKNTNFELIDVIYAIVCENRNPKVLIDFLMRKKV